jgi:hypothetical protein
MPAGTGGVVASDLRTPAARRDSSETSCPVVAWHSLHCALVDAGMAARAAGVREGHVVVGIAFVGEEVVVELHQFAGLVGDVRDDPGVDVAVHAFRLGAVRTGLPRCVVRAHLMARRAEAGCLAECGEPGERGQRDHAGHDPYRDGPDPAGTTKCDAPAGASRRLVLAWSGCRSQSPSGPPGPWHLVHVAELYPRG